MDGWTEGRAGGQRRADGLNGKTFPAEHRYVVFIEKDL